MATKKTSKVIKPAPKKEKPLSPKKIIAKELTDLLNPALGKWKTVIGEKKFDKRIKKAVKILAEGLPASKKAVTKKGNLKLKK